MAQDTNYLVHHGVKGMKWGVRKTPEQLGYRSSNRTSSAKAKIGKSTKVAKRLAASSSSKMREKFGDPEFQRKVATGAKVALAIGVIYAGHKLANNPQAIQLGKNMLEGVLKGSGSMKMSMINSTEFKVAKAALGVTKKGLQGVASENFRNTVAGIGAMATTAAVLKAQIKDFKENSPDGDSVDKALSYTKKGSEILQNVNSLAKGPNGNKAPVNSSNSSNSSNSNQSNNDSSGKPKTEFTDKGGRGKFYANRHLSAADLQTVKKYKMSHPNMTTKEALDELGWLDKERTVMHSSVVSGWHFTRTIDSRSIL